jgi:hypothetical protein
MTLKNRVPKRAALPLGFGSLAVMVIGLIIGYILVMVGITTFFGQTIPSEDLSRVEALTISGVGVASILLGYIGWKGFLYFSY